MLQSVFGSEAFFRWTQELILEDDREECGVYRNAMIVTLSQFCLCKWILLSSNFLTNSLRLERPEHGAIRSVERTCSQCHRWYQFNLAPLSRSLNRPQRGRRRSFLRDCNWRISYHGPKTDCSSKIPRQLERKRVVSLQNNSGATFDSLMTWKTVLDFPLILKNNHNKNKN